MDIRVCVCERAQSPHVAAAHTHYMHVTARKLAYRVIDPPCA